MRTLTFTSDVSLVFQLDLNRSEDFAVNGSVLLVTRRPDEILGPHPRSLQELHRPGRLAERPSSSRFQHVIDRLR